MFLALPTCVLSILVMQSVNEVSNVTFLLELFVTVAAAAVFGTVIVPLTLFRTDFFGAAHGWTRELKGSLPKIGHTYPKMMKLGSYTLPKEDQKNI